MNYLYNLSGEYVEHISPVPVSVSLGVKKGQLMGLSDGDAVPSLSGKLAGVSAEEHSGVSDPFNSRSVSPELRIYSSPDAVFGAAAPLVSMTGGDSTHAVTSQAAVKAFADGSFKGGWLVMVKAGDTSANTDGIGKARRITGFTSSTGSIAVEQGGVVCSGDVYALIPPLGFAGLIADETATGVKLASTGGILSCVGHDKANMKVHVKVKQSVHAFA